MWSLARRSFRFCGEPRDFARAQSCRQQARRLREKAINMDSPEIRQAYEEMATEYERLAADLEPAVKRTPLGNAQPRWG